jgi:hypothetical protein
VRCIESSTGTIVVTGLPERLRGVYFFGSGFGGILAGNPAKAAAQEAPPKYSSPAAYNPLKEVYRGLLNLSLLKSTFMLLDHFFKSHSSG